MPGRVLKKSAGAKKQKTKRDLFAELSEGFDTLSAARKGKRTLRTQSVEHRPDGSQGWAERIGQRH